MSISFDSNRVAMNSNFGINFNVRVDDLDLICSVDDEALIDINPDNMSLSAINQFRASEGEFQSIANILISNNQVSNGYIIIDRHIVSKYLSGNLVW